MEYNTRKYPLFSAYGLNCGLCPRYQTEGSSKCPGCGGDYFLTKHPSCGVLSCSQEHKFEYCHICNEYPCKKYAGADTFDSFITHLNQFKDNEKMKRIGFENYKAELDDKTKILGNLIDNYNDGRRKNFFCIAVNLLELNELKDSMTDIEAQTRSNVSVKEKSELATKTLQTVADDHEIVLKLRKK